MYADIDNLLRYTQIGNLFLDRDLSIRKINDVASSLTNILPTDIGRPVSHLSIGSLYPGFMEDVYRVTDTLIPVEKEVQDKNGIWFLMRILPYRNSENAIDGIIITFVNVSGIKESQQATANITDKFSLAMEIGQMAWWEWDCVKNVVTTSRGKYEMLGYKANEIKPGYEGWTELVHPDDYEICMEAMKNHLHGLVPFYQVEYRILKKDGTYCLYFDKGKVVQRSDTGKPVRLMGVVQNISDRRF